MDDFRISVFLSVAKNLSFTKSTSELMISQPAISRHINEIERQYGVRLFMRKNNRIYLTSEGELFLEYAQKLALIYRELRVQITSLGGNTTGQLAIGASTTAAQYILPSIISEFKGNHPSIEISLVSGNSEYVEGLVESGHVDLGIVEGKSHKKEFRYRPLLRDELVVIKSSTGDGDAEISVGDLKTIPLVVRERGSGTLEVIEKSLEAVDISLSDLNIEMRLGSSEAIKRYVLAGRCYAIISVAAIVDELRAGTLTIVDVKGLEIEREFSVIERSGSHDIMANLFVNFAITNSYG